MALELIVHKHIYGPGGCCGFSGSQWQLGLAKRVIEQTRIKELVPIVMKLPQRLCTHTLTDVLLLLV